MSVKTHLAVCKENGFGGHSYGTLCGRESGETVERNAENAESQITCKLCKSILANPMHWRYRKWLQ
jgi:hypothetical protein